jgi:peptidyl-prolyl cis-trans isomerase-like 4
MSVAVVTTRGAFVVDLYLKSAPMCGFNFLKLAKLGWFNNALFIEIIPNFMIRVAHLSRPSGQTIYSLLSNDDHFYVPNEINTSLTHSTAGLLSTCNEGPNLNNSNFFITLGGDLRRHDTKRSIFGEIAENFEIILRIATDPTDPTNRPLRNIRILKTEVLFDPFDDPPGFDALRSRFAPIERVPEIDRIEDDDIVPEIDSEEYRRTVDELKARRNAAVLEMLGDIPSIDARPPDTTLFICKLNPITTAEGLKIFFSRFGDVNRVDLIRDKKTGGCLCYAFVVFEKAAQAENAFLRVQRAVIDGRIVLVDFCQSVRGRSAEANDE